MASLITRANGLREIRFFDRDGLRKTVRLGDTPLKDAQSICGYVNDLAATQISGQAPRRQTTAWLSEIGDALRDRLAAVGLTAKRGRAALGPFIDDYIASRSDIKGSTLTVYGRTRRHLVEYFGEDKPLRDITDGDAKAWAVYLAGDKGLANATVKKTCAQAKHLFAVAVDHRLIDANPFRKLGGASVANKARMRFISRADIDKVIAAAPDSQWKLIIALARYGGLRTPSETLALQWHHVDWEHGRLTVPSPKTERHEGHASRIVPLFPELVAFLQAVFDEAAEGEVNVITRYRLTTQNLGTQFARIIRRAGLQPWPKLFQNLRSTRETELAETFPEHVVCGWIGNSVPVARRHYLQTTDDHFARAIASEAHQNAHQSVTDSDPQGGDKGNRDEARERAQVAETTAVPIKNADSLRASDSCPVAIGGPKHPADSPRDSGGSPSRRTTKRTTSQPDDLAAVVAAWPSLSAEARRMVVAIVRSAGSENDSKVG